jgi:hypothetical protein
MLSGLIVGCDRSPVAKTDPSTAPANEPTLVAQVTNGPATEPASTQPRGAAMLIDGRLVQFPPAKLVLKMKGGMHALLFSDDPPDAIRDDYAGNSFYFDMPLEIAALDQLGMTKWILKAPTSERSDTVSGIYLDGRKKHLQPFDVVVEFDHEPGRPVKLYLSGQFLLFGADDNPTSPGQLILVSAELDAPVAQK